MNRLAKIELMKRKSGQPPKPQRSWLRWSVPGFLYLMAVGGAWASLAQIGEQVGEKNPPETSGLAWPDTTVPLPMKDAAPAGGLARPIVLPTRAPTPPAPTNPNPPTPMVTPGAPIPTISSGTTPRS